MKNNTSIPYNLCLVLGDALAVIAAFTTAYILRVSLSHEVLHVRVYSSHYIAAVASMLPFIILIFALIGLYNARVYEQRFHELGRLIVGSFIGLLFIISYSYIANVTIFPARLVTAYAFVFTVVFLIILRTIERGIRRWLYDYGVGINNILIVGDTIATERLIDSLEDTATTGQKVVAVVGGVKHALRSDKAYRVYSDFKQAAKNIKRSQINTIIQTELFSQVELNDEVLTFAQENHINYGFVPGNSEIFMGNIEADLFYNVPIIAVNRTALVGWGRVVKRTTDLILGLSLLIITSPIMLLFAILVKFSDGGHVFYRQERLTRFNRKFKVFKFRSHKAELSKFGLTLEEQFKRIGREDLIEEYHRRGDQLPNDPRVTGVGRFMRKYSIDELPQLFNVLKGDISLVGPRPLIPQELDQYPKKSLILTVRSGLTGLAQISGVSDLSVLERRNLDVYYVENWTFWGDLVILAKTFWVVVRHKGRS